MENLDIYLRVSTDSQIEDGFGIKNQKELGLKVSEKLGMKPKIWDEGSKSSNSDLIEDRPILNELIFNINDGKVKNLWVFNNDRLSRNENVWNTIRLTLRRNGCSLYVGEGTKYKLENYMDDFIFGVMSEVSKYDNRLRTERLRRGKLSKVKGGGWKGGPPPFGYELKDGKLIKSTKESNWIRKIYEEYSNGTSIYQITKLLMKNGVLSRRGNVVWSEHSVRKILQNTHYEGYYFYTDKLSNETVKVPTPKLLPSTLIKKVKSRFKENQTTSNYVRYETLLRDYLYCKHCGSKFGQRISKSQYKNHYFCRGNSEKRRKNGLDNSKICETKNGRVRSLEIEKTDKLVWENVINVIEKSSIFKEMFKEENLKDKKTFGKNMYDIKNIQRKIKQNERKIKDIDDVMLSNKIDGILDEDNNQNFKNVMLKFEEKKRDLLSENEEMSNTIYQTKQTNKWVNWIDDFKGKIKDLRKVESFEERKKFLSGVVEKIYVETLDKQNHKLDIQFNSPFVNDSLLWNEKGKPKKGYKVIEGIKNYSFQHQQIEGPQKGTKKNRRI
jgi:site-specific DNA recombinase